MNHPQCAGKIAMLRPAAFGFNHETAGNNFFQHRSAADEAGLQHSVLQQFDDMVSLLRNKGIDVMVMEDVAIPPKPDAIFPNNWFSCNNGVISIFPMYAANRRLEKRPELIEQLQKETSIFSVNDLSPYEEEEIFLEGTGSMVFDHQHKIAYACYSERTNENLFESYCKQLGYLPLGFNAADEQGRPIYHTNVMMCVGEKFAVICLDALEDAVDRLKILHELSSTGHEIVDISFNQMNHFAGNMLEMQNNLGEHFLVMSAAARASLIADQISRLEKYASIISPDIALIENIAGGSVRCMMAELFC